MMFLKVKICSVQPRSTLQNILLGKDNNVIPRQLLQSDSVPFLGIGIMTPLFQSFGIPSPFHILVKSGSASSG